ncbi:MAG: hypothetical protein WB870_06855 [Gallionellaceae bacterium]
MSAPEKFSDAALVAMLPKRYAGLDREARIRLIGNAATALLKGELPDNEARMFLAGGLLAWLAPDGGDLCRDHFRVVRPKSHQTPARIWQEIQAKKNSHLDEGKK